MGNSRRRGARQPAVEKKSGWLASTRILGSKVTWIVATVSSVVAGTLLLVNNFDQLKSKWDDYVAKEEYLKSLENPYPHRLEQNVVETWSSGQIMLALSQIDGYLGRSKDGPKWLKECLTSSAIWPGRYFNEKFVLPEKDIDRQNRAILQRRLDRIDTEKEEDAHFLGMSDPFERLLARSSKQFLSRYGQSELALLEPAQLYLLRNAIYGQHGFRFDTPKLKKFANRMGWKDRQATYQPDHVSKVERCNAFYLEERHPVREFGALGRGVLVRSPDSLGFRTLKSAVCTCLRQPKLHVECREGPGGTNEREFRDYVDLIIEFLEGPANRVSWTFVDRRDVTDKDLERYRANEGTFASAALDFSAALQTSLRKSSIPFGSSTKADTAGYWGVQLSLTGATIDRINAEPGLMREFADEICVGTRRALDAAGPHIPSVNETATPVAGGPEIQQKPIEFTERRVQLTRAYVQKQFGLTLAEIEFTPRVIVIHSQPGNLESVYEQFRRPELPAKATGGEQTPPEVNLSVHYLVDSDGGVYSLMKDFYIARHVAGIGPYAIGIASIGSDPISEAQISAITQLIQLLKKRYDSIDWLVASSQLQSLRKTDLWVGGEFDDALGNTDANITFMQKIFERVKDLNFKGQP
jgi:hypothetical protein